MISNITSQINFFLSEGFDVFAASIILEISYKGVNKIRKKRFDGCGKGIAAGYGRHGGHRALFLRIVMLCALRSIFLWSAGLVHHCRNHLYKQDQEYHCNRIYRRIG